jgi:hypothetical protein
MMKKNYRKEILAFLAVHRNGASDIQHLLAEIIEGNHHSAAYLTVMLQNMRSNHLLQFDEFALATFDLQKPVLAWIEPNGLAELNHLKLKDKRTNSIIDETIDPEASVT